MSDLMKDIFVVLLISITTEDVIFSSIGTMISDRFVLTYGMEINNLILYRSQVIFSNGEEYDIVEKYIHPLFNGSFFNHHNLALLGMKIGTVLDNSHRPACLWTNNNFESNDVQLYNNQKKSVPHEFLIGTSCIDTESSDNTSLFCVVQSNAQNHKWTVVSFIVRQVEPNSNRVATKISDHLDWIESIVWPTTTCGLIQINIKPRITYSTPTFHGEFPWHAAIYNTQRNGGRTYICGGTLLNENTVLTAAHCVTQRTGIVSPHLLIVSLGTYDLSISNLESRESNVDRVMTHEQFNQFNLENNIAILKLKTIIEFSNFIQPICLTNDSTIFNSTVGVISGWGRNELDIAEDILKKASMPILKNSDCRKINREFDAYLNDHNFCAGYCNGTSMCSGDSGAGLTFQYDGRSFIRGMVSLGVASPFDQRCDPTQPTIFIDVVKFYNWITDKL